MKRCSAAPPLFLGTCHHGEMVEHGPTMQVMPGSSWSVVDEAKDLNPFRVRLFRYKSGSWFRQASGTREQAS